MTITTDHVRRLLDTDAPDAALVLVDGHPEISTAPAAEGVLVVVSRDDLMRDHGQPPGEEEIRDIAQALNTAVTELGG
ncbi:MAG TPA: hypothetical protein VHJ17_12195 [Thermomonospora sp.]|nr:hypothetical protein [Thermomonospora sp.]